MIAERGGEETGVDAALKFFELVRSLPLLSVPREAFSRSDTLPFLSTAPMPREVVFRVPEPSGLRLPIGLVFDPTLLLVQDEDEGEVLALERPRRSS